MGAAAGDVLEERFRLIEPIGSGGMGDVWRAHDQATDAAVAVKVIRPDAIVERSIERFRREAEHAASIHHPHVVEVVGSGVTADGHPFLAMELLEGQSLEARLEGLPPPMVTELVDWIAQALEGLAAVHAAGIVHRDLKPANLFLAQRGPPPSSRESTPIRVKVLDFGLARAFAAPTDGKPLPSLTETHQFLGTPYYASPEQVRSAKRIDARSDLFAIGVILYESLAGRRPFDGPSAAAVIASVVADDPVSLGERRPDLPEALVAVVHRALARQAADRWADAASMRDALRAARAGTESLRATPRLLGRPSDPSSGGPTELAPDPGRTRTTVKVPARPSGTKLGLLGLVAGAAVAGTVAWAYASGTGTPGPTPLADTPATPVDEAPPPTPDPPEPLLDAPERVAGPGSLGALALRFRELPEGEGRALLRLARDGDAFSIVAPPGCPRSAARALAARLGGEPVPFLHDVEGALVPELVQTTVSLNVRRAPGVEGGLVRTLPRGTILVGLRGRIEASDSELGGFGSWLWVAVDETATGWAAARFLVRDTGCLPSLEALLTPAAGERALSLSRVATVGRVRARLEGTGIDAFITVARDEAERRSLVVAQQHMGGCALDPIRAFEVPGAVVDVLLTETEDVGGESLLLVSWIQGIPADATGDEMWTGFRLGADGPVWEARIPTSENLPAARRATVSLRIRRAPDGSSVYFPFRVRYPDGRRMFFEWDGTRLVEASVGGALPVAPEGVQD